MSIPSAIEFKGRPRDATWERELCEELRKQPEHERHQFLMELVKHQPIVALQLAHKTLESRTSFVALLEFAVVNCDASSIKYWLDSVVPRLGFRRTVDNLIRLAATNGDGVEKALYWLPRFVTSDAENTKLDELRGLVEPK
jgi:hypothetical protein